MGAQRDERLNRMFSQKKVSFIRPESGSQEKDVSSPLRVAVTLFRDANTRALVQDWFNLFVLHQNRDNGRGPKNCVHETMIPAFMVLASSRPVCTF
jgi:double-strand break repair protein MRE11